MEQQLSNTVTFFFTDMEGSSRLWDAYPNLMRGALERHDALVRLSIESHSGRVLKTMGDGFCATFETAQNALEAALSVQRALLAESWGEIGTIKVRIGLHTGTATWRDNDYFGPAVNRAARVMDAGHGGQTLVSQTTAELLRDTMPEGASLRSLGEHHLKGLERSEHLFQILAKGLPDKFPQLRTLELLPNNLPTPSTSFIGREKELEEVKNLLLLTRLLTLTGTGGTGKTRLSIETGLTLLDRFKDGVWLVELALLTNPLRVIEAVATVVGAREESERPLLETLSRFLKGKSMLLILDNCEQVTDAAATLCQELLRCCPDIRILATSRQSLGLAGETTWAVPPLGMKAFEPDDYDAPDFLEHLSQYEAVKLFIERATAVRSDFKVTRETAPAIAEICYRLDGIPLAVELAAARVRVLGVAQIAERLNDRFNLLRGGKRDTLPHQQTLQALIDWSYELLSEPERILFCRLGVFAGGRTLGAIEGVCSDARLPKQDILDLLQQLVDKSLVTAEINEDEEQRYTLIESVWYYTQEKLEESGEHEALKERHLDYFLAFAERVAPLFEGREQLHWLEQFHRERYNFRRAMEWALVSPTGAEKALRLVWASQRPMEVRGNLEMARTYYEAAVRRPEAQALTIHRARALDCAGRMAWTQDRYEDARRYYAEAMQAYKELGDEAAQALIHCLSGFLDLGDGDFELAGKKFQSGVDAGERLGIPRMIAVGRSGLGSIALHHGDLQAARAMKEESLAIYNKIGDQWIVGLILWGYARVAIAQGDFLTARNSIRDWAEIARAFRNRWTLTYVLETRAELELSENHPFLAATLFGAAEALRDELGLQFTTKEFKEKEILVLSLKAMLSEAEMQVAWQQGRDLTPWQALRLEAVESAVPPSA